MRTWLVKQWMAEPEPVKADIVTVKDGALLFFQIEEPRSSEVLIRGYAPNEWQSFRSA